MNAISQKRYTLEEYAELEYNSERRHYFYNGIIAPMGYTSEIHGDIIANFMQQLMNAIEDLDYKTYAESRLIYVPTCNLSYYPDIVLIKGEQAFHQLKPKMKATLNPYALIEVISASTEHKDRFDKWQCYREIPSLRQYFMISQTNAYIDIYNRIGDSDKWENSYVNKMEQTIRVAEFDISLATIYKKVTFPPKAELDASAVEE